MKKILLPVFLLLTLFCYAQKTIETKWETVDSLEVQGLTESANEIVSEIMDSSQSDKDYINFIKAKIYHYKFYQINHEQSNQTILGDLNQSISEVPAPYKNILISYKAEFLQHYFQTNRWQIRDRKEIDDPRPLDIESWSASSLQDFIIRGYDLSLQNENQLLRTTAGHIRDLLIENPLYRKYKPSLYDVLSHRALAYFSNSGNFTSAVPVKDTFENDNLFEATLGFGKLEFSEKTKQSPEVKVLQIYQDLESLHSKGNNTEALVFNQLGRLEFVKSSYTGDQRNEKYQKALERLAQKYSMEPVHAMVLLGIAKHFYTQATKINETSEVEDSGYLKKSVVLCDKIIEEYPNSPALQDAYRLKASITGVEIDAKTKNILAPKDPGRVFISYKNIDSVSLKIFKVPESFQEELTYQNRDSIIREYATKQPYYSKIVPLPKSEDHNRHSTEFAFPGLDKGNYLVYISGTESNATNGFSHNFIQVTSLVLAQTRFSKNVTYRVIDRTTGHNISGAKIELFVDEGLSRIGNSNTDGEFKHAISKNRASSTRIRVTKKGDTLNTNYWSGFYNQNQSQDHMLARTLLYLDRAIYRPGQKVYFKGVLLKNKDEKTTTVPKEYVEVYIDDPNGEEIESFRLKTNKYGSFNGEFTLPSTGITGAFRIYTQEDSEGETPFWNTILNADSYRGNALSFSVEEYKRPTFEVLFDTIKTTFNLRDTIELSGEVLSFMGASLSNTEVKYEVIRERKQHSWWRDSYSDKTILSTDSTLTDASGKFYITFPADARAEDLKRDNLIYRYTIKATVTDVSGETHDASSSVKVGYKNLQLNLTMQEVLEAPDSLKPRIQALNLNDNPVAVSGTLRIYKLQAPDRILGERLWEVPEIATLSKEEFIELFPNEPYESENQPENWLRGELKYEANFTADTLYEPEIPILRDWNSGIYRVEIAASNGESVDSLQRNFSVINEQDKYLADNQPFALRVSNSDFRADKQVKLLLQTAYKSLNLEVALYDNDKQLFREFIELNGNKRIDIPLRGSIPETLEIRVSGVKNNTAITQTRRVSVPIPTRQLNIETQTFRNKIEPGVEETWSFKITNEEDEVPDAEVLASMYDASLDQFKIDNWNVNPGFAQNYFNFPAFSISNMGLTSHFYNNFPRPMYYRDQVMIFDRLNTFGFYYSTSNNYQYRQYLDRKKNSASGDKLKGNTRGKVTNTQGHALAGVNVVVKGNSKGTTTNFSGEFALDANVDDILVVSFLGHGTYEYRVGKSKELFIVLEQDAMELEEVVTIGFAEQEVEEYAGTTFALMSKTPSAPAPPVTQSQFDEISSEQELEVLEALENIEIRTNLAETAFFFPELRLDDNGKLQFSFTSPQALTRWKLRLLGHTNNWSTGKYENALVTQKELNITPNPPRFLREHDTITFKSRITNLSGHSLSGTAVLELFDATTMELVDIFLGEQESKTFTVEASQTAAVSWQLVIPQGLQGLRYRVLAKAGKFSDGVEDLLPVLSNRQLVEESIAFFVRPGQEETFELKNLKENTSNTLVHHSYSLEYSSNPAWYALLSLQYLMEVEHQGSEQIFARLYANSLGAHILNSQPKIKETFEVWTKEDSLKSPLEQNEELKSLILAETPWLDDAKSESAYRQRIAKLFDRDKLASEQAKVLKRLAGMQNSSGAFPWFPTGRDNYFITRHIVAGLGHLRKLGVNVDDSGITEKAIAYLDKKIVERQDRYADRDKEAFYKSTHSLHYLYARSFFLEEFPLTRENQEILKKSIQAQKKSWMAASLYNKGLLMLIFSRNNEKALAEEVMMSLKETAVKSDEYGMYWKENQAGWHYYNAPIETQALLIEAFAELDETNAVEEMKIWLLQNKRTNHWPTTKSTTEATYALLLQGKDWLQTQDNTKLLVGGSPIPEDKLQENEKEVGTGYRKVIWEVDEIKASFSQITVQNNNSTAGYGGAYWQYFEDIDKVKSHDNSPLSVEKQLYLNVSPNGEGSLQRISIQTPIKTGDLITVRLVVRSTTDMDYIHLKDMRASGFEPTNVLSGYKYQDGTAYYESTRDAATHFFFDSLNKGTYVLEYTLRANNSGKFSNGITTIENMYAPEFSSHTKGIRVNILDKSGAEN